MEMSRENSFFHHFFSQGRRKETQTLGKRKTILQFLDFEMAGSKLLVSC